MTSPLPNLNVESAMLMYVADELPADARTEFEQKLASDAELRRQVDELRTAYSGVGVAISEADSRERLVLPVATASRRVGQAVRSWHLQRLANPAQRASRGRLRLPWWSYPLAGAAMITIALSVYWHFQPDTPQLTGLPAPMGIRPVEDGDPEPEVAVAPMDVYPVLARDESDKVLDVAEAELYAMIESSSHESTGVMYNLTGGGTESN
jgi:hypothetical protein